MRCHIISGKLNQWGAILRVFLDCAIASTMMLYFIETFHFVFSFAICLLFVRVRYNVKLYNSCFVYENNESDYLKTLWWAHSGKWKKKGRKK